ncbi:probable pectinesterase/pectinesterase inhibitor 25 [Phoenix dactylifera]|uniref:Probable pectinesterase/pectinesterase inhibitor 25 n=1 Tax=Phoenix dactylifera TaxID=42345 RepID=A0A8B9A4X1_PHODC|nr:probable pectinesterase/pectinesterase inhibitor 25 [Phoenix dactylifera]
MCLTPAFFLLLLHTAAVAAPSPSVSTAAACKSSLYPKLCRAVLAPLRLPSKPYEYGRFSVKQALKRAGRTSKLLDHYLAGGGDWGRGVGGGALEDCRQLNGLNLEYLETVEAELGPGESVLNPAGADRVRALMSAVRHQPAGPASTASKLPESSPSSAAAFSDETRVYGVSLELVSAALGPDRREPVRVRLAPR